MPRCLALVQQPGLSTAMRPAVHGGSTTRDAILMRYPGYPHHILTPCPLDARVLPGPAWGAWPTESTDDTAIATCAPTGSEACIARREAQPGRQLSRQPAGRKSDQMGKDHLSLYSEDHLSLYSVSLYFARTQLVPLTEVIHVWD